ncbi:MAG: hypothetical protein Q9193_002145 [Seirophora villosa]
MAEQSPQAFLSSYAPRLRAYTNSLLTPVIPQSTQLAPLSRTTKRGTTAINYAENEYDDDDIFEDDAGPKRLTGLRSRREDSNQTKESVPDKFGKELFAPVNVQGTTDRPANGSPPKIVLSVDQSLRKMLLGQRSLATLASVLKREAMRNQYEMLKLIAEYNYSLTDEQKQLNLPILGIKPKQVGMLQYEGWGKNPRVLFQQVDTLVVLEGVRRGLDMPKHLYGFVDKRSGLDIWTSEQRRKRDEELDAGNTVNAGG